MLELTPPTRPSVFLTRDLPARSAEREVAAGRWLRVRRGAYTATPTGDRWDVRRQLALAHAEAIRRQLTCSFSFAGATSALLRGWWLWDLPDRVHVLHSSRRSNELPADVLWSVAAIDEADIEWVAGARITSAERTLIDCARLLHPRDALVVVDSGFRALVRPTRGDRIGAELRAAQLRERLLERLDEPWARHGRLQARAVIEQAEPFAESPPESVVRWIAVSRGLPRPVPQLQVRTDVGTFYPDLSWLWQVDGAQWRTYVEYDGTAKYGATGTEAVASILAEKAREEALRRPGNQVIRIVRDDLRDEDAVADLLTRDLPPQVRASLRPVRGLFRPPAPFGGTRDRRILRAV